MPRRRRLTKRAVGSCGKIRYRDRVAAVLAMASAQHKDGARRAAIEQRAYPCPACRGWHLTSRA